MPVKPANAPSSSRSSVLNRMLLVLVAIIVIATAYLVGLSQGTNSKAAYQQGYADGLATGGQKDLTPAATATQERTISGDVVSVDGPVVTVSSLDLAQLSDASAAAPATVKVTVDGSTKIEKVTQTDPVALQDQLDAYGKAVDAYNALSDKDKADTAPPVEPATTTSASASLSDLAPGAHVTVTSAAPVAGQTSFTATDIMISTSAPAATGPSAPDQNTVDNSADLQQ